MTAFVLGSAYVIDLIVGDPEWFPHPVRAMGWMISAGESLGKPGRRSRAGDLVNGTLVTLFVVGMTLAVSIAIIRLIRLSHPALALVTEVLLAWTVLATGSLLKEAGGVIRALTRCDLPLARTRLARIVGRDTATLGEAEIARGVIETLAESTCDAIVAPLCFLVAGGVPAALAYKAINTLDSMIGHREAPYTYFGRAAARLDDVANLVPARLAAVAIALGAACAGASPINALRVWWRDHANHDSPNAGNPEAAMAGALGVRLGGINYYDAVPAAKPLLGAEYPAPTLTAVITACRVVTAASLVTLTAAVLVLLAWRT